MLIGNKIDLVQENPAARKVSSELVESFCKQHGLEYMETSAKTGENIRESFDHLLIKIYEMGARNPGNKGFDNFGQRLTKNNVSEGKQTEDNSNCCN